MLLFLQRYRDPPEHNEGSHTRPDVHSHQARTVFHLLRLRSLAVYISPPSSVKASRPRQRRTKGSLNHRFRQTASSSQGKPQ